MDKNDAHLGAASAEAAEQGAAYVEKLRKEAAARLAECEPEAVWLRREVKRDPRGTYEYLHGDANRVPPGIRRARGQCVNGNRRPGHRSAASTCGSPDDSEGESEPPEYRRSTFLRRSTGLHDVARLSSLAVSR